MLIKVGVSNRHVHLKEETFKELFDLKELPIRNNLNQPGQYASTLTVDLKWNNQIIEKVRIVGPFRTYNQIEISASECEILNVTPPRKQSGDLAGSLPITLVGPKKEITLTEGLIQAENHIHIDPITAKNLNLKDKEKVEILKDKNILFKSVIKISDTAFIELHIDKYEEKIYDLHQEDEVEFQKCGK